MKIMEFVRKLKYLIISIFFFGLLLTFIISSSCVLYFLKKRGVVEEVNQASEKYKYLQVNSLTNESSVGMMSIFREIEDNEIFHIEGSDGNHVFVSNFGSTEYQCTGSCYCDQARKQALTYLSSGMKYLVAAATSVVALVVAKEYFEEECKTKIIEQCPEHLIQSKVDDCTPLKDDETFFDSLETKKMVHRKKKKKKREEPKKIFHCTGNCLSVSFKWDKEAREAEKQFRCNEHKHHSKVNLYEDDVDIELLYINKFLNPYCKQMSKKVITEMEERYDEGLEDFQVMEVVREVSLCMGGYYYKKFGKIVNYSVRCVESIPHPQMIQEKEDPLLISQD